MHEQKFQANFLLIRIEPNHVMIYISMQYSQILYQKMLAPVACFKFVGRFLTPPQRKLEVRSTHGCTFSKYS